MEIEKENKRQEATFDTQVGSKDLFDFKVYHYYHSASGIVSVMCGVILLTVFAVVTYMATRGSDVNITFILMTAFFGLFFTVWTPVGMWLNVRKQMKKAKGFTAPIKYEATLSGIKLSQGEISEKLSWDDVFKIKFTGKSLVLYITAVRANVIPLRDIGTEFTGFISIARKKLRPFQVKVNDTKVLKKLDNL